MQNAKQFVCAVVAHTMHSAQIHQQDRRRKLARSSFVIQWLQAIFQCLGIKVSLIVNFVSA